MPHETEKAGVKRSWRNPGPQDFPPPKPKRKIQLILVEGIVDISNHCRRRMRERGVDDLDVAHVLREGEIIREAEWDPEHEEWKYRIEGKDVEGEELTAITVIFEADLKEASICYF